MVVIRQCVADRQVLSRLKVKTTITLPGWSDAAADAAGNVIVDAAEVSHY